LLDFDNDVVTNCYKPIDPYYEDKSYMVGLKNPLDYYLTEMKPEGSVSFAKGEMTGRFEMGSTIVLIYETNPGKTSTFIKEGDAVRLGQQMVLTW